MTARGVLSFRPGPRRPWLPPAMAACQPGPSRPRPVQWGRVCPRRAAARQPKRAPLIFPRLSVVSRGPNTTGGPAAARQRLEKHSHRRRRQRAPQTPTQPRARQAATRCAARPAPSALPPECPLNGGRHLGGVTPPAAVWPPAAALVVIRTGGRPALSFHVSCGGVPAVICTRPRRRAGRGETGQPAAAGRVANAATRAGAPPRGAPRHEGTQAGVYARDPLRNHTKQQQKQW